MSDKGWAIENLKSGNWMRVADDGTISWPGDWRERTIFTDHNKADAAFEKTLDCRMVTVRRKEPRRPMRKDGDFDSILGLE